MPLWPTVRVPPAGPPYATVEAVPSDSVCLVLLVAAHDNVVDCPRVIVVLPATIEHVGAAARACPTVAIDKSAPIAIAMNFFFIEIFN